MTLPRNPIVVIPARLASTRYPDKPLANLLGEPMIVHVWRHAVAADLGPVLVASGDAAIADASDRSRIATRSCAGARSGLRALIFWCGRAATSVSMSSYSASPAECYGEPHTWRTGPKAACRCRPYPLRLRSSKRVGSAMTGTFCPRCSTTSFKRSFLPRVIRRDLVSPLSIRQSYDNGTTN